MKNALSLLSILLITALAWAQNPVTFQVNMDVQEQLGNFNPETDQVVARGSFNGWGGLDPTLTDSGDMIFTGSYDLGDELIDTLVEFKFVIVTPSEDVWEQLDGGVNRSFTLTAGGQTLDTVYFNNQDSVGELINVEVLFRVNMEVFIENGGFDPANDWIVIRGGHENLGNWGGAVVLSEEGGNPGHYFINIEFDAVEENMNIEYKFVILQDQDENLATWEGVANRTVMPMSDWPDDDMDGYLEHVQDEVYFDNVSWDDVLSQDVVVHFMVDLWPVRVWFEENPGGENQGILSYDDVNFVAVCGPWNNWPWGIVGPEYQLTNTTGDWYEGDVQFVAFASRNIVYKYGINGEDNESGFQADWTATIDDATGEFTINNLFGSLGDLWFDGSHDVDDSALRPASIVLGEAYPNPFNPVTTVPFTLRNAQQVSLKVYNLAGQEVATLAAGPYAGGEHAIRFDASSLSSGLYMVVLEGETASASSKLMLVK